MKSQTNPIDPESKSALKAVVLYEKLESGISARGLLKRVSDRLPWAKAMESVFWRFDVMSDAAIAREALYRAADADIVLIVARERSQPPEWLLEWLELWALTRRIRDVVLAAWCAGHASPRESTGVGALRELARRHGFDFICADAANHAVS